MDYIKTGIEGFDMLLGKGIKKKAIILISGGPGTGKTTFTLQILYNGITKFGENGAYMSFEETKESIYSNALQYGWDFEKLEKENKFVFYFYKPHQVSKLLDEGGGIIKDTLLDIGVKRLGIDSITAYSLLFKEDYEKTQNLLQLYEILKKWNVNTFLINEMHASKVPYEVGTTGFLSDGIFLMDYIRSSRAE